MACLAEKCCGFSIYYLLLVLGLGFDIWLVRHLHVDRLEWESQRSGQCGVLSGGPHCWWNGQILLLLLLYQGAGWHPLGVVALSPGRGLALWKQEWCQLSVRMFSCTSLSYLSPLCNHNTAFFDRTLGHDFSQCFWGRKSNGLVGSAGSSFSEGWEGTAVPSSCLAEGLPEQLKSWHDVPRPRPQWRSCWGEFLSLQVEPGTCVFCVVLAR